MSNQLTDIHIHLLPGLDDGPNSVENAVDLARQAYETGTRVAVCTPHLQVGNRNNTRDVVLQAVAQLAKDLERAQIDLQLLPGAEVMIHPSLPELHTNGLLPTIGDHGIHLLLELPWTPWPPGLEELIFKLRQQGLEIIIAHPERYSPVQKNPSLVEQWVDQGLLIQANAPSLADPKSPSGRLAHTFLQQGLVHFIGSDGHSRNRPPVLGPLLNQLSDRYGEQVQIQAVANAAAVAAGSTRQVPPIPVTKRRKSWFWWLK